MRRWNGWGEDDVEVTLAAGARGLLERLIGPGAPPARREPRGRPGGRAGVTVEAGCAPGPRPRVASPPRDRPEPAGLDRHPLRPHPGRPRRRGPPGQPRRRPRAARPRRGARRAPGPVRRRHERGRGRDDPAGRRAGHHGRPRGHGRAHRPRPARAGSRRSAPGRSARRSRRSWARPASRSGTTRSRGSSRRSAAGSPRARPARNRSARAGSRRSSPAGTSRRRPVRSSCRPTPPRPPGRTCAT